MLNVYFVNDTAGHANWGCRGTTRALRGLVADAGGHIERVQGLTRMARPERVVPAAAAPLDAVARRARRALVGVIPRSHTGPAAVATRAWRKLARVGDTVPERAEQFDEFAHKALAGDMLRPEVEAIRHCDVVLVNGEGSIYDTQRKGRMMLFVAYLAKRHLDTPVALVNHTADVHDPAMREMVDLVYPLLDDVVFREPLSARACGHLYPDDLADRTAADAAFGYRPADRDTWLAVASRPGYFSVFPDDADGFDPSRPYVAVGASSIYLRPDRPDYDPRPAFAELCRRLKDEFGQVVLTAPDKPEEAILRPVAAEQGLPLIGLNTPTHQAIDVLGHAAAYVSGRWHPSIFALCGGTPLVTLTANTYKTQALIEQVGHLGGETFDALALHERVEDVVRQTLAFVDQGEDLRAKLRQRADELRDLARRNVRFIERSVA